MLGIAEAIERMLPAFQTLGPERVSIAEAAGRYLCGDVTARFDSPPFDNSAMDGYAVRAADVGSATRTSPVRLRVLGEARAGGPLPGALKPGAAWRIFTGAPMPAGADAVVIQEDTKADGKDVIVYEASRAGRHVRAQGGDFRREAVIVRDGARLGAGELGLLASQNLADVTVYRRPTVAVLCTGDELREVGTQLDPGSIVNSNAYALAAMIETVGAIAKRLPIVGDDQPAIEAALQRALKSDVVLTMGGVSVGAYDLVHNAYETIGIEQVFWKVSIKPGKPFAFALHKRTPVIGLPGNPISAMITFEILVAPCLRAMLGDPSPNLQPVRVRLAHPYERRPGRIEIARGVMRRQGRDLLVELHDHQGSGSLSSFAGVNALVILPADRGDLGAGDEVEAFVWGPGLRSEGVAEALRSA